MKKWIWIAVLFLCLAGCAKRQLPQEESSAPVLSEAVDMVALMAELAPSPTPEPPEVMPLKADEVSVEAGGRLDVKAFFEQGEAPKGVKLLRVLTEEQMRSVGTVYDLTLSCDGQYKPVKVDIVDTTPPTISGAEDLTVKEGDTVSYRSGIILTDNADGDVTLEIDNTAVDLSTVGDYPVTYVATDASGNSAQASITLHVVERPAQEVKVNELADKLIAQLITDDMSKWDICYKLWNWCRLNIRYSYTAGDRTLYGGAYEGLYKRYGDCYAYYATFTILLQKCGIETMEVRRVGGKTNHWWNLVNLGDGWYHCDSSPRRAGDSYKCFMQTDAQVQAYTESYPEHPNYYVFDESLYPERATEIVYDG